LNFVELCWLEFWLENMLKIIIYYTIFLLVDFATANCGKTPVQKCLLSPMCSCIYSANHQLFHVDCQHWTGGGIWRSNDPDCVNLPLHRQKLSFMLRGFNEIPANFLQINTVNVTQGLHIRLSYPKSETAELPRINVDAFRGITGKGLGSFGAKITSLRRVPFDVMMNAQWDCREKVQLDFVQNMLETIESNSFENLFRHMGCSEIDEINLKSDRIQKLSENSFSNMRIGKLDLSGNTIKEVHPQAFVRTSVNSLAIDLTPNATNIHRVLNQISGLKKLKLKAEGPTGSGTGTGTGTGSGSGRNQCFNVQLGGAAPNVCQFSVDLVEVELRTNCRDLEEALYCGNNVDATVSSLDSV